MSVAEPSKVAQRKEDKRRRVLDAALVLFAERGFHGTAVPLVAERAGVAAGTIYLFFESKEVLVNAVFQDTKARLRSALADGLDLAAPPRALFDAFWARLVGFVRAEPVAFHFLELQDHAPYLDPQSRTLEQEVLMPIFLACSRFQQEGVFRPEMPIDATMAFVWGAFIGLVKAARHGYLTLTEATLTQAREACWRAFAVEASDGSKSPARSTKRASR
jgi:AcrR family transcriptional regulator